MLFNDFFESLRPTRIDAIEQEKVILEEKEKQRQENLKLAAREIFKGNNGIYILNFLKNICLWNEQDTNINPNMVLYKKGRQDIWLVFRNILPKDILTKIEINGIEE